MWGNGWGWARRETEAPEAVWESGREGTWGQEAPGGEARERQGDREGD